MFLEKELPFTQSSPDASQTPSPLLPLSSHANDDDGFMQLTSASPNQQPV